MKSCKQIIIVYCIAIFMAVLIVPYKRNLNFSGLTTELDLGYHLIFSIPKLGTTLPTGITWDDETEAQPESQLTRKQRGRSIFDEPSKPWEYYAEDSQPAAQPTTPQPESQLTRKTNFGGSIDYGKIALEIIAITAIAVVLCLFKYIKKEKI